MIIFQRLCIAATLASGWKMAKEKTCKRESLSKVARFSKQRRQGKGENWHKIEGS